ncbi:hypothetical protein [Streptomyces sp. NPDC021212]|uniref:allene oxide cyclase barrel-like domain-containing protein n=1 Tax=Streptomyces sp. NPDC021212 TaxID=3365118 RepID=UPI0037AFCCBF
MRRVSTLGLTAAALTTALVCATPASAAGHPGDHTGREQVFELVAHETQASFIDVGTPGASQGDEFVIAGDLLKDSATVGTFDEVCTLTRVGPDPDSFNQQCVGTLVLPGGDITFQGLISITAAGPGDINVAITGGTGRYRTAHGFIHADNISETDTDLTVHLIL